MSAACVEDAGGQVLGGLPVARIRSVLTGKRLVALPFTDACPPLVAGDAPDATRTELEQALRAGQAAQGLDLEVRDQLPGFGADAGERFYRHTLELNPDPAAVEAASRSRRSSVASGRQSARESLSSAASTPERSTSSTGCTW